MTVILTLLNFVCKSSEIVTALLDADYDVELKSQQLTVSIVHKYYQHY